MKSKFSQTISIVSIIGLIVLMQLSFAHATKPEGTPVTLYFWSSIGSADYVEVNKIRFGTITNFGTMGPSSTISGDFVWSETSIAKYISDSLVELQFTRHFIEMVITGNIGSKSGTITIDADVYITHSYDPPSYDKVRGTWKIVSGTGDFAELKGKGELTWWEIYQFDGIIYGL